MGTDEPLPISAARTTEMLTTALRTRLVDPALSAGAAAWIIWKPPIVLTA